MDSLPWSPERTRMQEEMCIHGYPHFCLCIAIFALIIIIIKTHQIKNLNMKYIPTVSVQQYEYMTLGQKVRSTQNVDPIKYIVKENFLKKVLSLFSTPILNKNTARKNFVLAIPASVPRVIPNMYL